MKTILVPLDGSELAARALPYATALARNAGARVELVRTVLVQPIFRDDRLVAEAYAVGRAETEIEQTAAALRADGIVATAHVLYDAAAGGILQTADTTGADLIVMSTHGRGGLGRVVYGSVADVVLRGAHVPVLVVPARARPAEWRTARDPVFLVALDGSELSERALPAAVELARLVGARLVLFEAVEPAFYRYGYAEALTPSGFVEPDPTEETARARAYLTSIADRLRQEGIRVDVLADYGPALGSILEAAHDVGALATVVATHGRGGIARLVLGSIATGLLQHSDVPVLLTHPAPEPRAVVPVAPPTITEEPHELTLLDGELRTIEYGLELLMSTMERDDAQRAAVRTLLERIEQSRRTGARQPAPAS